MYKLLQNILFFKIMVFVFAAINLWLWPQIWARESMHDPTSFAVNLKYVDPTAYRLCKELEKKAEIHTSSVKFMVSYNFYTWLSGTRAFVPVENGRTRNEVYFHPQVLKAKNLRFIIGHELGHIKNQSGDQHTANEFAAKLFDIDLKEMSKELRSERPPTRFYLRHLYSGPIAISLEL